MEICAAYAAHFGANVLAIDYRGFGDSTGVPSEEGLVIDARSAFDWVVEKGTKSLDDWQKKAEPGAPFTSDKHLASD